LKIATNPAIVHISLVLTAILSLTALPSPAKQSPCEAYTQRIANDIEAQRKTFLFPKVLAIDFPTFRPASKTSVLIWPTIYFIPWKADYLGVT
jgi:hypothetical protein